jgi:antirestriction protein ArdC
MEKTHEDVYTRITNQIIEELEQGAKSLRLPWHITDSPCFQPVNAVSKRHYRGINVLALWAIAHNRGYKSGLWGTFKQWTELGARIKRGEKAALVILWKVEDRQENEDETEEEKRRLLARGYYVFNVAQVEGYEPPKMPELGHDEKREHARQFFDSLGVDIKHGGTQPYYDIMQDVVWLPEYSAFRSILDYYSVLAHETTHWTGATSRLNRSLDNRFGDAAYAMEELVAELGAAFLCSKLNLTTQPRPEHSSYIDTWLHVLKRDKRAIFTAAAKAQQATDWMLAKVEKAVQPAAAA